MSWLYYALLVLVTWRQGPIWEIVVSKQCKTATYYAECLLGQHIDNPEIGRFYFRSWHKPTMFSPASDYPELHNIIKKHLAFSAAFEAIYVGWELRE